MLSIANISSSGAASSYYELDDYYAKDSEEHKGLSGWFGNGAKELGLKGNVDPDIFKAILEGILPNGIELGRTEGEIKHHAPGIDMTFSAPKSVSIMAEVGGDKRIYSEHMKAVKTALFWAENEAVGTRAMRDGKLSVEKTPTIIAALFRHDTSRNMDPQLHTHCVIANAVLRKDKEWRSGYFKEIFDNKLFIGQVYRTELAKGMSKLGYTVEPTHKDGRFELREVPKDVVSAFSSRSKEIRAALEKYEFANAKTAANAAIRTRDSKVEMDRDFLKNKWQEISKNLGFEVDKVASQIAEGSYKIPEPAKKVRDIMGEKWERFITLIGRPFDDKKLTYYNNDNSHLKGPLAERSVKYAVNHLSERSSVFEIKDIYRHAMSYGIGKVGYEQIEKSIANLAERGVILKGEGGAVATTPDALSLEKKTIGLMSLGKNRTNSIIAVERADAVLDKTTLNESQKAASRHILTSRDSVMGVQGYAGVGKTFMLNATRQIAESQGYKMIGMAPSASAADTLEKDSGIKSQTIHKFLYQYDGVIHDRGTAAGRSKMRNALQKTILVLDESSLASTKQIYGLLKVADRLGTKVVLLGDEKQLGAVDAGKPFSQLQAHGMAVSNMVDIFRQKTADLKSAVLHSLEGNVYKALDKLGDNVIEASNISAKAAELWLSHKDRDNTLVLAPSNSTRQEINSDIRVALKEEGIINSASEIIMEKLANKGLTVAEATYSRNYDAGDIVLFNKNFSSLGAQKGEYYTVSSVDHDKSVLTLASDAGKTIKWSAENIVSGSVELFTKENIELAEGDEVVWKRNDKANGLINSNNATVKEITDREVTFIMQGGKERTFDKNDPAIRHIDYAYAVTVYSAQGKTADNVIAVASSKEQFLTTQPTFYVEISRAKYEATLVVDDKAKVADMLSEATGVRVSAMESQGLVYEGESPFVKAESDAALLQSRFAEDYKLNEIAKSTDTDLAAPIVEIEKYSALDEIDALFESRNYVPSEKSKHIATDLLENTKSTSATVAELFPEMFDDKPESFDEFMDRHMPKVTNEDREAKIAEIKAEKAAGSENNCASSGASSEDKKFNFDLDR